MKDVTINPDLAWFCLQSVLDELRRLRSDKGAEARDISLVADRVGCLKVALIHSCEDDEEIRRVITIGKGA